MDDEDKGHTLGVAKWKAGKAKIRDSFVDLAMPVVGLPCLDVLQENNMDI